MRCTFLLLCCMLPALASFAGHKQAGRVTLSDPAEENYDMKHITFRLSVTDSSTYIVGDVATTAQVVSASFTSYVFELDTAMHIDSAKVNGTLLPVATSGAQVRSISLPAALSAGAMFTAEIWYHGTPAPSGSGFFNCITQATTSLGTPMIYTVSDPWVALNWWPTKQDVDDKIDSVDMYVTVPRGQQDGSNGLLVSVDSTTLPGYSTWHWQTHYAINYYLISIAVAPYTQEKYYMHFTGSSDSMLIQNFFLDTATFYPAYKANFDSIPQMINYFSSLYGRYPFWNEKYGVCYTTLPGGMEHQTMTTIGVPNTYIIAHELCHQWFGDHVSYADWGDVWMSEGFATFSEQMYLGQFWGSAAALAHRKTYLSIALGDACGEMYVTDTSDANTLFYQPTVYAKGQGVITMLRYLAPTDSLFFQALRNYQATYGLGNANNAQMKAVFESTYGFNLDTFFNEWVYGKGYPDYRLTWDQSGSTVTVKLVQTRSCVTYDTTFSTLLELQLHSATADTVLKIYNNADTQVYTFNWAPTVSTVYFNPDVWTIAKQLGSSLQDTTLRHLAVGGVTHTPFRVFPNPAHDSWEVQNVIPGTALILTDLTGKVLWRGISGTGNTIIPASELAAGSYYLEIGNNQKDTVKLTHW